MVAIVGHLRHMPMAFAASDIAVFPVIEPEAFGRGAVEAQAMGVPVIASNLGGYTETVRRRRNRVSSFRPAPRAALAGAIERMIDLGRRKDALKWAARAATACTRFIPKPPCKPPH